MVFLAIASTPLSVGETAGALFGGVFGILLIALCVAWILFPFFVVIRLGILIKLQRAAQLQAESSALHTARQLEAIVKAQKSDNDADIERNKALQWFVENWPQR